MEKNRRIEENGENRYKGKVNQFSKTVISKPEKWLIENAARMGLDYSELSHEITNHFRNHVIKRHGQGQLPITEKDFDKIPAIVELPDNGYNWRNTGRDIIQCLCKKVR